jgi:hypothetical protein
MSDLDVLDRIERIQLNSVDHIITITYGGNRYILVIVSLLFGYISFDFEQKILYNALVQKNVVEPDKISRDNADIITIMLKTFVQRRLSDSYSDIIICMIPDYMQGYYSVKQESTTCMETIDRKSVV